MNTEDCCPLTYSVFLYCVNVNKQITIRRQCKINKTLCQRIAVQFTWNALQAIFLLSTTVHYCRDATDWAPTWPPAHGLKLMNPSDGYSSNISKVCWYSIRTGPLIEEKQSTDQADWPLIEGMSLWLCGMKCDWLKGGNHSLGRQTELYGWVPPHLTDFFFFLFLDLHAFRVNWFLIHPVLVQPGNTGHLF